MSGSLVSVGSQGVGSPVDVVEAIDSDVPAVQFRIPSDPAYVRVARLVAGDMGGRAGFSLDDLDDVRLAVDEMCAVLIEARGDALDLCLRVDDGTLLVECRTSAARDLVSPSELSQILLRELVDSCTFRIENGALSIEMRKRARGIA